MYRFHERDQKLKVFKSVHGHEVEGFQIAIADTCIPSSQTQNQTDNLRQANPNKKHKTVGIQLVSIKATVMNFNSLRGRGRVKMNDLHE